MFNFSSLILSIPFSSLLFALVFLVYWVNAFFILYHLTRFGIGIAPKLFALVFFVGAILLFMITVSLGLDVDARGIFEDLQFNQGLFPPFNN